MIIGWKGLVERWNYSLIEVESASLLCCKVANLFHSFHRTFHPPKRDVKRVISSIIIIYICLHTKQSYEGSRRFIYTFDTLSFDIR